MGWWSRTFSHVLQYQVLQLSLLGVVYHKGQISHSCIQSSSFLLITYIPNVKFEGKRWGNGESIGLNRREWRANLIQTHYMKAHNYHRLLWWDTGLCQVSTCGQPHWLPNLKWCLMNLSKCQINLEDNNLVAATKILISWSISLATLGTVWWTEQRKRWNNPFLKDQALTKNKQTNKNH